MWGRLLKASFKGEAQLKALTFYSHRTPSYSIPQGQKDLTDETGPTGLVEWVWPSKSSQKRTLLSQLGARP